MAPKRSGLLDVMPRDCQRSVIDRPTWAVEAPSVRNSHSPLRFTFMKVIFSTKM
jgi:hypothetical protein